MHAKFLIVVTGGTIDAEPYLETPENITPLKESIIPSVLEQIGRADVCDVHVWKLKDSKDISEAELLELISIINREGYTSVVITHGTDTMPHNARFMAHNLHRFEDKVTIIFTGAMIPFMNEVMGYAQSDGPDNVSLAIHESYYAPRGVHIAFAGRLWDPFHTVKDMKRKEFVHTDEIQEPELLPAAVARSML